MKKSKQNKMEHCSKEKESTRKFNLVLEPRFVLKEISRKGIKGVMPRVVGPHPAQLPMCEKETFSRKESSAN